MAVIVKGVTVSDFPYIEETPELFSEVPLSFTKPNHPEPDPTPL